MKDRSQRYKYEMRDWGDHPFTEDDYGTLEDAINDMARNGWRFVETVNEVAVFERPADNGEETDT